jgi:hydroxymethylpyrimidine/phosphomethylpyrimidine kinase
LAIVALTIAGADPTGAAGIAADLKTFHQAGAIGQAVVTLVTVQSAHGVARVVPMSPELVGEQIAALAVDGRPAAVKTGALGTAEIVRVVARELARAGLAPVVDPVMLSTSGHPLLDDDGQKALLETLVPIARLLTPNAPEAEALTGQPVRDLEEAERAGRMLLERGAQAVLVKGGHLAGLESVDLLVTRDGVRRYASIRSARHDVRGTGCTLSAAITALLGRGLDLETSVELSKAWLTAAIESAPSGSPGRGALDHFAPFPPRARGTGPL